MSIWRRICVPLCRGWTRGGNCVIVVSGVAAATLPWWEVGRMWGHGRLTDARFQAGQETMLRAIQSVQTPWLDTVAVGLSRLGNYSSYFGLGALVLLVAGADVGESVLLAALAAMVVTDLAKWSVVTPRPIGAHGVRSEYVESAAGASFPSGHALVAMSVYERLRRALIRNHGPLSIAWTVTLIALPLAIGLSRLYLGVHWPVDVVAGWLIGWWLSRFDLSRSPRWSAWWRAQSGTRKGARRTPSWLQAEGLWLRRAGWLRLTLLATLVLIARYAPLVADTDWMLRLVAGVIGTWPLWRGLGAAASWRVAVVRLLWSGVLGLAISATLLAVFGVALWKSWWLPAGAGAELGVLAWACWRLGL